MNATTPARPPEEPTTTLLARRSTHYVYDRRTRMLQGRQPVHGFPGLHETLAVHLAAVLPPRVLARVSAERLIAITWKPARALALAAPLGYRALRAVRRTVLWIAWLPRRAARRALGRPVTPPPAPEVPIARERSADR